MNIILSVYSKDAFLEYQLPSVNNADYTLTLKSDFYHLKKKATDDEELEKLLQAYALKKENNKSSKNKEQEEKN